MPGYDWMGVMKRALEEAMRYVAAYLGPLGVRANVVAAGPLRTAAATALPMFTELAEAWAQEAPIGWDVDDRGPVADAVLFLLSDAARGITGEVLHVDGGYRAAARPR
jgi:meromycolic acid enoyl-[acyl-carrier-protein] reductase